MLISLCKGEYFFSFFMLERVLLSNKKQCREHTWFVVVNGVVFTGNTRHRCNLTEAIHLSSRMLRNL